MGGFLLNIVIIDFLLSEFSNSKTPIATEINFTFYLNKKNWNSHALIPDYQYCSNIDIPIKINWTRESDLFLDAWIIY